MATTELPAIDYSSGDFQTFLDNLLAFLETELPEATFNDFVASNIMMFMLRMNAYLGDVIAYKLDIAANENFLVTAKQRRSIIRFAKSLGFKLNPATASSVTLTLSIPAVNASPITIRGGTIFTVDDVTFEIDQDYVIPAGQLTVTGAAIQGQTAIETFTSNGAADQQFIFSQFPIIRDSTQVLVDSITWTEVEFIAFADANEQVYVLSFDENDQMTVTTGNGTFGLIPPLGSEVRIITRVGGGASGNVTAGAIDTTIIGFINNVTQTSVTVVNPTAATGGSNPQSVEDAKLQIPGFLKTINHAVTDDDYDSISSNYSDPAAGTVAKANATLREGELNKIDVFIWTRLPDGSLTGASLALRNSLKNELESKNVISHDVAVFSGVTQSVNVAADIVYQASKTEAEVTTAVQTALEGFFNDTSLNPGDDIFLSRLYNLLQAVDGVQSLLITDPTTNVSIPENRMAVLGTTTFTLTPAELGT